MVFSRLIVIESYYRQLAGRRKHEVRRCHRWFVNRIISKRNVGFFCLRLIPLRPLTPTLVLPTGCPAGIAAGVKKGRIGRYPRPRAGTWTGDLAPRMWRRPHLGRAGTNGISLKDECRLFSRASVNRCGALGGEPFTHRLEVTLSRPLRPGRRRRPRSGGGPRIAPVAGTDE